MKQLICTLFAAVLAALAGCGGAGSTIPTVTDTQTPAQSGTPDAAPTPTLEISPINELEDGFSSAQFAGDNGFEDFLASGGASSDGDVIRFLAQRLAADFSLGSNPFGCSTLAVQSPEGHALFGRNFNWQSCDALVLTSKPTHGYVSPSLVSMFGVTLGDEIVFPIARAGGNVTFTVAGFYEDPMMGSSMIGMKGFLICREDHDAIVERIRASGIDALARDGAMLHIFSSGGMTTSELNQTINQRTSLPAYTEFVHTAQAIRGFMLILQNAFSGLLLALVAVLLAAVLVVLSHSIGSAIQADYQNMGVLKTVGFTSGALRRLQLLQYGAAVLVGMALGLVLTLPAARLVGDMTLTTTGIRAPIQFPALWCAAAFGAILLLLGGFILWKTGKIGRVSPMKAIRGEMEGAAFQTGRLPALRGSGLLTAEQRDTGIYKALGFSTRQLRASFALRFGLTAALGGVIGAALTALLTDPLVSSAMRLAGISNFTSAASLSNTLLPAALVSGLFTAFAYLWAGKIKKTDLTALITE